LNNTTLDPRDWNASATASHTWSPFTEARAAYEAGKFDGVGLVMQKKPDSVLQIVGFDFDKCRDPATGQIDTKIKEHLTKLNTYSEISPSRTGIRAFAKGDIQKDGRKKQGVIEIYKHAHYLTLTGQRLSEYPSSIETRPDEIAEIYNEYFPEPEPTEEKSHEECEPKLTDDQIICLASEAKNSKKFMALMAGNIEGYSSQSEADQGFCNLVAFYTTQEKQIDRIFRRSKLYREKWERADYREGTIRKATSGAKEHYSGNGPKDFGAATGEQKSEGQDDSESDAAADSAEAKAAEKKEEPLRIDDVSDIKFDKDGEPNGYKLSITKAAHAIVKKKILVMSEDATEIYRFDGQIYRPDGERLIDTTMCTLMGDDVTIVKLKEILRRVRNELLDKPVVFEPDPYLLAVKNGVADLRTGIVREYHAEDLLLEQIDVIYDAEARCPAFLAFLESITPSITDRLMLIDWFGATAIKEPLAYVLFLLGLGRNGKGIYEKLIKKFFGMTSFRDMPLAEVAKNNFAASGFYRKRGWIASETGNKKANIGTDFMKLVSGNGVIDGDRKNKSRIQFEPYFQTMVDSNTMPKIEDSSIGWTERFCKANLPYVFVPNPNKDNPLEKQRDPALFKKLSTPGELSGILNLVLFRSPDIVKTKTIAKRSGAEMFAEYAEQSSSVTAFLDMFCEYGSELSGLWTPSEPIYEAYKTWCGYKVGEVVDIRYFGKQLTKFCGPSGTSKQGKDKDRNNIRLYKGLIFDSDKCKTTLEALQESMSPDVFESTYESSSCIHEEEEKKSQKITMSSLSLSNQWKEILKRFGNLPNIPYKRENPKKTKTIKTTKTTIACAPVCSEPHEDTTKTATKTKTIEADQQDAARDQNFKDVAGKPPLVCAKCGEDLTGHGQITKGDKVYCAKVGCGYPSRGEAKAT
jgi:putative DNA primase/helicase